MDHHQQSPLWSIWREEDATCIGINEELFENILDRVGSDKVFETDCMKTFICMKSLACMDSAKHARMCSPPSA